MRAFRVAYDGRSYYGFQRQPDVPTVEDAIFDAVRKHEVTDGGKPPGYAAAGRTDAGVSALAQTVAFETPVWLDAHALNGHLPDDVWAWAHADAPDDFHATHDARSREYVYFLHGPGLDADRAAAALDALSGEHDYHNLTTDDTGTVRDVEASLDRAGEFLEVTFRAGGFPRQFVRRAVEVVREVGSGESGLERVGRVLGLEQLDGAEGVPPAPPYPLVLADVTYDLDFTVDGEAAPLARDWFAVRRSEALSRARAAEFVRDRLSR